ncbi:MAG: dienelactone hydrolase family protein [Bacteroidetes bacterium]|nr:dienelactone hydrolase family protein [Bacteroidota bacterium]
MSVRHNITVPKTANYYTIGNVKTAKTIWIVLHGYGYLAEFFIKKFEPIVNNETCIIAPEALSKFYLNGVGVDGRVGASWMTKHQREDEIIDYTNYLQLLFETVIFENINKNTKVNIVGFSQGGATACRWFATKKIYCTNLILWASVFPEDVDFNAIQKTTKVFLVYGTKDEFLTEERVASVKKQLANSTVDCKIITFDGSHDIPKEVLVREAKLNEWG